MPVLAQQRGPAPLWIKEKKRHNKRSSSTPAAHRGGYMRALVHPSSWFIRLKMKEEKRLPEKNTTNNSRWSNRSVQQVRIRQHSAIQIESEWFVAGTESFGLLERWPSAVPFTLYVIHAKKDILSLLVLAVPLYFVQEQNTHIFVTRKIFWRYI